MIAVVQRVAEASVRIEGKTVGKIGAGLLLLLGVEKNDTGEEADYLAKKVIELRIFQDSNDKMNLSLQEVSGEMLVVSQFTLLADCRKGRRPSFNNAADPALGEALYNHFIEKCRETGIRTEQGVFGAMMKVSLINDGPVTIIVETRKSDGERKPVKAIMFRE